MNFRKSINFLEYLLMGFSFWAILVIPSKVLIIAIIYYGALTSIELIYYSIEYFKLQRPKKIFIFNTRYHVLDIDSIIRIIVVILLLIVSIINLEGFNADLEYGLLFSGIITFRSLYFDRFKQPILKSNRIMFESIFDKDILLKNIAKAAIDTENNNILLMFTNNSTKTLRLKYHFFEKRNEKIIEIVNQINNIANR